MSKLRLIQCGIGGFGSSWLHDYVVTSPDFEVAAVVDTNAAILDEQADKAGIPAAVRFSTLAAALDAVSADAVLTVTPPVVHIDHARLTFARGLHLMTEKPMADTIDNALTMNRLAAEHGLQLVVSQNYRYRPPIQKLRQLVAEQALGALGHGHIDFYIPADFTGTFRETMEYPLLIDMAIHHLDLVRCVTGRNIVRITAFSFSPEWSWYSHDPGLKMVLELEGGGLISYSGDWSARGRATSWNGDWRLQCAEGSLHLIDDQISMARSERWNRDPQIEAVKVEPLAYAERAATLHRFAEAIRGGQPAETSGDDNLNSFGAVIAGVLSAREGRPVMVAEALGRA